MTDISCEIIRDLIPLCVDHMASQESEGLVKEHIQTCEDCRNYYDVLKTELETMPAPPNWEPDARELKQFKRFLSMKKWQAVLAAMAGLLLLLVGTIFYMNHKVRYINYDEAGLFVIMEDQDTVLFTDSIKGNYRWAYDFDVNTGEYSLHYTQTLWDRYVDYHFHPLDHNHTILKKDTVKEVYVDEDGSQTTIWEATKEEKDRWQTSGKDGLG